MILFFWYVSFVLSEFFSFSLFYVFVMLRFFFLLIDKFIYRPVFVVSYARRSIILSLLFFCLSFSLCRQAIQQNLFHFDDYSFSLSLRRFSYACRQHRQSLIGYIRSFLLVFIVPLPIITLDFIFNTCKKQQVKTHLMIIIVYVTLESRDEIKQKKIIHIRIFFF